MIFARNINPARRVLTLVGILLGILGAVESISYFHGPFFYINTTASVPKGLYLVRPVKEWRRGMLVLFRLPARFDEFASHTSWLSPGRMLIKPVGALPGDEVCVKGGQVSINGKALASVKRFDDEGNELPRIERCFVVREGEFFPFNLAVESSFDGRYIGQVEMKAVVGEGEALWLER